MILQSEGRVGASNFFMGILTMVAVLTMFTAKVCAPIIASIIMGRHGSPQDLNTSLNYCNRVKNGGWWANLSITRKEKKNSHH